MTDPAAPLDGETPDPRRDPGPRPVSRRDSGVSAAAAPEAAPGPLAGLVVADFSRVLAGPYCTMLLADLGATVVKVEGPPGDETRHWMPPALDGEATYFLSVNRGKRAITLDFTDPADAAVARALAARADVVIENFKPGGLNRFALDYDSVRAANPGVVYVSITGFGPAADLPGYDVLAQALSGLMSITGVPDGPPTKAGVAIVDVVTGLHAGIGALAALRHRDLTGEGQRVEVNLLSSALSALVNQSGAYALTGDIPGRLGNDHPSIYPYGPFPTADGELVLAIGNDAQFARLCTVIGIAQAAADARFAKAGRPQPPARRAGTAARGRARGAAGGGVGEAPRRGRGALRHGARRRRGLRTGRVPRPLAGGPRRS